MADQINYKFYVYLDLLLDTLNLSTEDLHKCFDSESRKIKIFKYLNKAFSGLMNEMIPRIVLFH